MSSVRVLGSGARVVFVHGSVTNADWLWRTQRALASQFTLARTLMVERPPWDARFALDALAAAPSVSEARRLGHSEPLDAVCDVLEERLGAERAVLAVGSHNIPEADGFNDVLASFLSRASA